MGAGGVPGGALNCLSLSGPWMDAGCCSLGSGNPPQPDTSLPAPPDPSALLFPGLVIGATLQGHCGTLWMVLSCEMVGIHHLVYSGSPHRAPTGAVP